MKKKVIIIVSVILVILIGTGITYIVINKEEKNKDNQKCDSSVECCSGDTYPDNPNCEDRTSEETRTKLEIDEEILNLADRSFLIGVITQKEYPLINKPYYGLYFTYDDSTLLTIYQHNKTKISEMTDTAKLDLAMLNICHLKNISNSDCQNINAEEIKDMYNKLYEKDIELPQTIKTSFDVKYEYNSYSNDYLIGGADWEPPFKFIIHYINEAYEIINSNQKLIEIYETVSFNKIDYENSNYDTQYVKSYKDIKQSKFLFQIDKLESINDFIESVKNKKNQYSTYKHLFIQNSFGEYDYYFSELIAE